MIIAIICVCDSVCLHDEIKTAETKIAKLGAGGARYITIPHLQLRLGQKVKVTGSQSAKRRSSDRSAEPLVVIFF